MSCLIAATRVLYDFDLGMLRLYQGMDLGTEILVPADKEIMFGGIAWETVELVDDDTDHPVTSEPVEFPAEPVLFASLEELVDEAVRDLVRLRMQQLLEGCPFEEYAKQWLALLEQPLGGDLLPRFTVFGVYRDTGNMWVEGVAARNATEAYTEACARMDVEPEDGTDLYAVIAGDHQVL